MKAVPIANRFWTKVNKQEPNDCWQWLGQIGNHGYGVIFESRKECENPNKRVRLAHQVSYTLLKGQIPEGLPIDHLCRNRVCVNPAHMEVVTLAENVLRGESLNARRARQTHCIHGHLLSGSNLYIKQGYRQCRKCHVIETRRYRQRKMLNG
mgnify:CR=1 FL=1